MPKQNINSISAVFPAYNEEANIGRTIERAAGSLAKITPDFEIIVVNDGSKDNTGKIVAGLQKKYPSVRLVTHKKNQGYGKTVWDGIQAAKKDLIFFADSDGQFGFDELGAFIQESRDGVAVLGYRKKRQDHPVRLVNAYLWKLLVFSLLGLRVKDIDCAFKVFQRRDIEGMEIFSFGAMFSVELLVALRQRKIVFKQLPVTHLPRLAGKSTGANIKVILRSFKELFSFCATQKLSNRVVK